MSDSWDPNISRLRAVDEDGKKYLLLDLQVVEAISEVTSIQFEMAAEILVPTSLLGKKMTCTVYSNPGSDASVEREFEGYVWKVASGSRAEDDEWESYKIELRSWFWLLSYSKNYRVYQNMTTQDIVTDVLNDSGFSGSFQFLSIPNLVRPYCLQYGESDYGFVRRLLFEIGVNFFFEQKVGSHKMVIQEATSSSSKMGGADLRYVAGDSSQNAGYEDNYVLQTWSVSANFQGSEVQLANYDYEKTTYLKTTQLKSNDTISNSSSLVNFSHGEPTVSGDLSDLSDVLLNTRLLEAARDYEVIVSTSIFSDLMVNELFTLADHFDDSQLGEYLVTRVQHNYNSGLTLGTEREASFSYTNNFQCISSSRHFPPVSIPKPAPPALTIGTIEGTETGQPHQDNQGRVYVRFLWDDSSGDKPSGWIRVVQPFAGNGYGVQFVPRAGDEVLVSFVDQDIDRPVVMGSVYNSQNSAIYPDTDSTKSGIRTKLSGNSNELYFDDKSDAELMYLHAAKNMTVEVEEDFEQSVSGEFSRTIEKQATTTANDTYTLQVTDTLTEKANKIVIQADEEIEIKVGSNSITLTSSDLVVAATKLKMSSESDTSISAGAAFDCEASAASTVSGSAGVNITSEAKVEIEGKAGASVKSSALTEISGDATTTIKGGLVEIN